MQFGAPIYRLSDGAPATKQQKKTLRFHYSHQEGGNPVFVPTAAISTRTLASVGGKREGCNHTKRANKKARRAGFPDYQALLQHMVQLAKGDPAGLRRLMGGA